MCNILTTTSRGTKCTLCCDHKPSGTIFYTRGMKIAKLDIWTMLLQEYDITFVHIKGKDNILADAISRLCTIDSYEKALETQHSHAVKNSHHTASKSTIKQIQRIRFSTTTTITQHELCYYYYVHYKNKINSVEVKHANCIQA